MRSEIIAIGSEMLTPYRHDSNSLFLTEMLNAIGVTVAFKTVVGDRQKDLVNAIRGALSRTDIVILMGGLGPTEDDLTREAVAEALGLTLKRDASQVAALHARAAMWRFPMPDNNLKQADVIQGATVLPNPNGSAPGQWLDVTYEGYRKLVMLIPGPPGECKPLFEEQCMPLVKAIAPKRFIATRTLKAAMIGESQADKLLAPVYTAYTDVETTILAHNGDIQLSLICAKKTLEAAEQRVNELAGKMEEVLDDWLYSSEGESLALHRRGHAFLRGFADVNLHDGNGVFVERHIFRERIRLFVNDRLVGIFFAEIFEPFGRLGHAVVFVKRIDSIPQKIPVRPQDVCSLSLDPFLRHTFADRLRWPWESNRDSAPVPRCA